MKIPVLFTAMIVFTISLSSTLAQEAITATGGEATGSGGSVSYSVGQIFYSTNASATGSVAEGVQQPYEISVVSSVLEAEGIDLVISAFPNPVTDHLILRVEEYDPQDLSFQLFDVSGKMVQIGKVVGPDTIIEMTGHTPAVYLLKILDKESETKTFRIVKF